MAGKPYLQLQHAEREGGGLLWSLAAFGQGEGAPIDKGHNATQYFIVVVV